MTRRLALSLSVLALTAFSPSSVAGCGVPEEDSPRAVTPPRSQFDTEESRTAEPTETGSAEEQLCFVRDNQLVVVSRGVPTYPSVNDQLGDLLGGPTEAEHEEQLSSTLDANSLSLSAEVDGREAVVEVGGVDEDMGRTDEILMYGQIVCTLTTRADILGVSFAQDGEILGIPRSDGSLSEDPLTRFDYEDLIAE